MKKSNLIGAFIGASCALAVGVLAGIEDVIIVNDQSLANAAAYTNSTFVRGMVNGVFVKIEDVASAARTNTIVITSADGQTIFSSACVGASTNFYPLAYPLYGSDAALINSSTVAATTNKVYGSMPTASKVTCTATGAAGATLTNSVTVKLLFER